MENSILNMLYLWAIFCITYPNTRLLVERTRLTTTDKVFIRTNGNKITHIVNSDSEDEVDGNNDDDDGDNDDDDGSHDGEWW